MREWIKHFLGIDRLTYNMKKFHDETNCELRKLVVAQRQSLQGIGHAIAKIDPMYGKHEILDPVRRAESDRLSQDSIDRILADDMARRHTLGEL